jgi:hypothetical protein
VLSQNPVMPQGRTGPADSYSPLPGFMVRMEERRKHTRLPARDNTFAALQCNCPRVGRLKNITKAGLALEYTCIDDSPCDASRVDIFSAAGDCHLSDLPCRIVYDIPLRREEPDGTFFPSFLSRQSGLQFEELTVKETEQLRFFIKAHAIGNSDPRP